MTDQSPADQVSLNQVAQRLDSLVQTFEQHPIIQVRDEAVEMLGLIDALHREGLKHLVEALQAQEPALLDQVLEDPAVSLLLALYDLVPPGPREQVEAALGSLGPYIASRGCSIEVLDVKSGVVQLALSCPSNGNVDPKQKLLHDIETVLRETIPGLRSIELREPVEVPPAVQPGNFVPLQQVRPPKRPAFTPVTRIESLPPGTLSGIEAEGVRILLCNLDGEVYAYRNSCPGSILPLDMGQLKGFTLLCPWHNCVYDVRTGKRLDGGTGRLQVIPVAVRDGMIQLALNVESGASERPGDGRSN